MEGRFCTKLVKSELSDEEAEVAYVVVRTALTVDSDDVVVGRDLANLLGAI